LLVATEDSTGKPVPLLVLRADPDEREASLSVGHPFFASRAGRDRIGVLLTDDTDWEEIRELVTESYRVLAPKKLTALRDQQRWPSSPQRARTWRRHTSIHEWTHLDRILVKRRWGTASTRRRRRMRRVR
jgi:hypothetical protein